MSGKSKSTPPRPSGPPRSRPAVPIGLPGAGRRIAAIATLSIREAIRNRVLLGMTALMCLFAIGTLMWPADLDRDRVILVQRFCHGALTFLGLIAAVFLAASALPHDISSKRIYAIATKPVSRFELLMGKTCGLIGVMFIFIVFGTLITFAVTHAANARKSYAGGSYTLEVTAPAAEIRREGAESVAVKQGEILAADGEGDDVYTVTIASRDASVVGVIAKSDVQLLERDLTLDRVVEPEGVSVTSTGKAAFEHNELLLFCDVLAAGGVWVFDLSEIRVQGDGEDVHVRMRFNRLLHETRTGKVTHQTPSIEFLFRNTTTSQEIAKEIDFTFPERELRPVPTKGQKRDYYERVFVLPRGLLTGGSLEAKVIRHSPEYPKGGNVSYGHYQTPTWRFRGFSAADLPDGQQTLRLKFTVIYTRGLAAIDDTDLTAVVTNPATGGSKKYPLHLRRDTTSLLHFDRDLIDDDQGVDVTLTGLTRSHRLLHASRETPLYLMLTPGRFWASTARSAFLIFLSLSVYTVLAVAASTFLSAPVAILLTLVVALAGKVQDLILAERGGAVDVPPTALAEMLRIPLLLIAIAPLLLAVCILARRGAVRLPLAVCLAAAFTWLAFFSSVAAPTVLVIAVPLTIFAWVVSPRNRARTLLGSSAWLMAVAFIASDLAQFVWRAAKTSSPLQQAVWHWLNYVLVKFVVALAPGFTAFSSSRFVVRGWSVPWPVVFKGTAYALVYMAVCFGLGYALFRKREFE